MKIYILCDMEGVSGITSSDMVSRDAPCAYQEGRGLMMQDINAAIDGACQGGATEIVVCDTHAGGGQLLIEKVDYRASYEMPTKESMMPSLDESFDGLILLGHHAMAGTQAAFLDHTMTSRHWYEYRINGQAVGEIGIEAAHAGHFGVPVIMVSGDDKTATEARQLLGEIECAVVKFGLSRLRVRCLPLPQAHALVAESARRAVARCSTQTPFCPTLPASVELTYLRTDLADGAMWLSDVERVDGRTVRRVIQSLKHIKAF